MTQPPLHPLMQALEMASMDAVAGLQHYFDHHILGDARFQGMSPKLLSEVTVQGVQQYGLYPVHGLDLANYVHAQMQKSEALVGVIKKPYSQWATSGSMAQEQQKISANFTHRTAASTEQKFFAGLSLLTAGLSAVNAYGHAKQIRQTDAEGKTNTQWSQLGMALLSATFAAGLAYVGVQQARGRMGAF